MSQPSQPAEPTGVLTPEEVLRKSGVPFTVLDHVPIVGQEDAETKLGLSTEQLLKTMVFRTADDGFVLAALPVTGRVNYGRLARAAGVSRSKLRQAEPGELSLLGMEPGGASPVCDLPDVVIVFDASVTRMGIVYCGSGRADRTVVIEAARLIELVGPKIEELAS
ncbi:aminoacyl-tRNA deacylase [Streptomyces hygroscopicus]|uniref:Cys-tRNA(Pro)/Cys-tRNA(Cys) deacylase n=1 Tax=Streptomyces demainii TaxID=588122 RepID=A0ABT9L6Q9_9ACTN|nr:MULTISPECIES: YbaK/EbsC family protein [Streptomyces]MDN3060082.1 YbaK/EbsC family protein [Streptomyces sp. SRF1]MDP9616393.1 Cys-tRNA(Pro)/Cys-tRNA(Cys) deacylase [Streptomyces demainii]